MKNLSDRQEHQEPRGINKDKMPYYFSSLCKHIFIFSRLERCVTDKQNFWLFVQMEQAMSAIITLSLKMGTNYAPFFTSPGFSQFLNSILIRRFIPNIY